MGELRRQDVRGLVCVSLFRLLQQKYHRLGRSSINLFLIVWEAGKSKIKAPVNSVSGEGLLPGS